jgi:hypothetical protein
MMTTSGNAGVADTLWDANTRSVNPLVCVAVLDLPLPPPQQIKLKPALSITAKSTTLFKRMAPNNMKN